MKRHKYLYYTGAFSQWLKSFSYHRTEHPRAIGVFHRVAWSGRGHKKIPHNDRPVLGSKFARHDSHDCERDYTEKLSCFGTSRLVLDSDVARQSVSLPKNRASIVPVSACAIAAD